jgi:hypothetical protein
MEYDAQLGDWVLLASLLGSEKTARDDRKAATAVTAANQTQVKGERMKLQHSLFYFVFL